MPRGRPRKIQPEAQELEMAPADSFDVVADPIMPVEDDLFVPAHVKAVFDAESNCVTFIGPVFSETVNMTVPKELIRRIINRIAG